MDSSLLLWGEFVCLCVFILFVSNFMAKAADQISELTGIGRSFIGVILLGTATSLPELGSGITAVRILDQPNLAAAGVFGACIYNLMIIGVLDLFCKNGPVLAHLTVTSAITGALSIAVLSVASLGLLLGMMIGQPLPLLSVSGISIVLLVTFLISMFLVFKSEREEARDLDSSGPVDGSLSRAVITYLIAAISISVAAYFIAHVADAITTKMAWNASYTGFQFMALSTTLPEMASSLAALRIGAPELAISNLLGSNMFNIGFILFAEDLALKHGAFWPRLSISNAAIGITAILMTSVVISAMLARIRGTVSRQRAISAEAIVLFLLFLLISLEIFHLQPG